jgi:quinol monooxygenase YgiN
MIVVAGAFPVDGSKHDAIVEAANAMRAATIAEDGCIEYRFSFATDDANTVLVFEEWRDQEALTAHFATPHMTAFQSRIVEFLVGRPSVSRYEASTKGPLR